MITVFKRRELAVVSNMSKIQVITRALNEHKICYRICVINQESAALFGAQRRGNYGSLSMNESYTKLYKIYVKKLPMKKHNIA